MYHCKKIIIPLICFFCIVSCGSDEKETQSTAKEQAQNSQTESSEGKANNAEYISPLSDSAPIFTVAIEESDYPPFEYRNEYGKYMGYDFDLIRAIGEEAGFKVQINPMPFVDVLPSLKTDTSDIAISALTASEERVSSFDPSAPYIKSASNFIVNADSEYQDASQLVDKTVAVQNGGFQAKVLAGSGVNYDFLPVQTNFLAFQAIFTGKAEALYADKTMLIYLAEQFPEQKVSYIPHGDEVTLSIFTKKGNNEVMAQVNKGLSAIKSNGRYQTLNKKWFGSSASAVAVD